MGIIATIYKSSNTASGFIGNRFESVCVVNVDGPFEATNDRPGVSISFGPTVDDSAPNIVCYPEHLNNYTHTMFGGSFIYSSDSRFTNMIKLMNNGQSVGAIPLHDRIEGN